MNNNSRRNSCNVEPDNSWEPSADYRSKISCITEQSAKTKIHRHVRIIATFAAVVLIMAMLMSITEIREPILRWITGNRESGHMEIKYGAVQINDTIKEVYMPVMPSEYRVIEEEHSPAMVRVVYSRHDGTTVVFEQMTATASTSFDVEMSNANVVSVGEYEGYLVQNESVSVMWVAHNYYFSLHCSDNSISDELLSWAGSIQIHQKGELS